MIKIMQKSKLRQGKYKVANWHEYNKSLKDRGDITIWITDDVSEKWFNQSSSMLERGRSNIY